MNTDTSPEATGTEKSFASIKHIACPVCNPVRTAGVSARFLCGLTKVLTKPMRVISPNKEPDVCVVCLHLTQCERCGYIPKRFR